MKDIQKIKEFFSQPEKESLTGGYPHTKTSGENFKKITITEPIDDATKNKMIKNFREAGWDAKPNNGGGITAIKKAMMEDLEEADINDPVLMKARAAAFQRTQPKSELPKPVKTINPDYKAIKNADKIKALKMRRAQLMSDMEQEAEPEGGPIANRYGRELNKIDQAISMLSEAKSNPEVDSTFNTNKVWAFIESKPFYNKEYMPKFSTAEEIWSEFGPEDKEKYANFAWTDTYGDNIHPREKSALQRKANYDKLAGVKEIDANDPILMQTRANTYQKSGKTINTKKEALLALDYIEPTISEAEEEEETAVDMAKKQLDDLGIKYEMSGDESRPFKDIYKPYSEDLDTLFNQEYELTRIYQNNKSEENWKKLSQIREKGKRLEKFDEIIYLFNLGSAVKQPMGEAKFQSGMLSGKNFINAKLQNYPKAVAKINQLIDMIGEDKFTIEMAEWIFDFFNNAHFESPVNEATKDEETKFHKKLDTLVHNTFGKRKSELEEVNLKQSKLSSAEYQKAKKLKDFKSSDWKWNANEDLYIKVVKEATDYMKRRKSENDYATSKEDKPKKPNNPNPSGKTDYMKRRQQKLAETILAKLKR